MTGKEMKEKVKKFREDHAVGIAYFKGVAVTVASYAIWNKIVCGKNGKQYIIKDKNTQNLLDDISKIDSPINVYCGISGAPIKIADMGKLGEDILEYGGNGNHELTHFLMVGRKTNQ